MPERRVFMHPDKVPSGKDRSGEVKHSDGDKCGSFDCGPSMSHDHSNKGIFSWRNATIGSNLCRRGMTQLVWELIVPQSSQDGHKVVAQVFSLKLKKLMDLLVQGAMFGRMQFHAYSNGKRFEVQTLTHAHPGHFGFKMKLHQAGPTNVGFITSAELPSPGNDPVLHRTAL